MSAKVFDLHCDTSFEMLKNAQGIKKNQLHIDLQRMEEYDTYIQVFAAFVDQKNIRISPMQDCLQLLQKIKKEIHTCNSKITLITSARDLEYVSSAKRIGAILSIEGGEALEGDLSLLDMYYKLGVRLITLTWNWSNELGDGILEPRGGGLTAFGKESVKMMEKMGILIDVSHLSEQGFWDVTEATIKPFVASHSCVKQLCPHPRNLTDSQISCLIQRRGGIGINFFPEFLSRSGSCGIEEIVHHIEYILELGGEDTVGLGSDFDGVSSLPNGMHGVEDVKKLISCMRMKSWSDKIVQKIVFDNFYRIFIEFLQ